MNQCPTPTIEPGRSEQVIPNGMKLIHFNCLQCKTPGEETIPDTQTSRRRFCIPCRETRKKFRNAGNTPMKVLKKRDEPDLKKVFQWDEPSFLI